MAMSKDQWGKMLKKLAGMLKTETLTAKQIASRMRCGRPAAYRRIAALRAAGVSVFECPVSERKTGPVAMAYRVR